MSLQKNLEKYADLVINQGLRVKKGDKVVLRVQVELYNFARLLAETAYKAGADEVIMEYRDEILSKLKYDNASLETLGFVPDFAVAEQKYYMDNAAKFLSVVGNDPNLLKDTDPEKIKTSILARSKALKEISARMMNSETSWCVIGGATKAWANIVFPELSDEEAIEKLWNLIFYTVRVDKEDPIGAWDEHARNLKNWSKFLNDHKFEYLKYSSEKGTDLKIKLPENYIFEGAGEFNSYGEEFIANMPTEEVFSLPHRDGANGIVYNTKPLNYNGNLIDDFWLEFKDGVVVNFDAKQGYEVLKNLLDSDEGSRRLGEVALVPYHSPISETNTLFYETLYDENASCHLALGKAYPTCIEGGDKMSDEELLAAGVNDSVVHVDFMIGDSTTDIKGITYDGEEIQIFKNGDFVI